jgi:hypothetical protein
MRDRKTPQDTTLRQGEGLLQAKLRDRPRHRSNLFGVTFDAQSVMPAPAGQPVAEREVAGRSGTLGERPTEVQLDVNSQSLTGALRTYQRAGLRAIR